MSDWPSGAQGALVSHSEHSANFSHQTPKRLMAIMSMKDVVRHGAIVPALALSIRARPSNHPTYTRENFTPR